MFISNIVYMEAQSLCFQMDIHSNVHTLKNYLEVCMSSNHKNPKSFFSQNYTNSEFAV